MSQTPHLNNPPLFVQHVLKRNTSINAVRAACGAVAQIDRIRAGGEVRGEGGFRVKIGLNSGPTVVGKIGTFMRGSYTAYGHIVNVAARLESVPALYHCGIVIGPQTAEFVQHTFLLRELDTIQVKEVELPITVFEPVGEQPGTPAQRELTARYTEALSHYRGQTVQRSSCPLGCLGLFPP